MAYRNPRDPKPEGITFICPTCKIEHDDITENYWQQRKYHCRSCRSAISRKVYWNNPAKHLADRKKDNKQYFSTIKYKYGLTAEVWKKMVEEQDGSCLICKLKPENPSTLHIDHDHITGKIRGLLCNNCNLGIGYFADNADRLLMASMYARDNAAIAVFNNLTESEIYKWPQR
jgi:hypothetical protein